MVEFRHIVRVANADLDGNKQLFMALCKIKGVSMMFANAICYAAGVERTSKTGELTEAQVQQLEGVIKDPQKVGIPQWLFNRRKDYESGEDMHIVGADLNFTKQNDIKRLQKVKSYRGLRLQWGLPVRGQRTKSNFRKMKGKGIGGKKKTSIRK